MVAQLVSPSVEQPERPAMVGNTATPVVAPQSNVPSVNAETVAFLKAQFPDLTKAEVAELAKGSE